MIDYNNIPLELQELDQWVCANKNSKVPMQVLQVGEAASTTNPKTWDCFELAENAVGLQHYDYCGFVFNDNGIVGIDIDDGYDEYGLLTPLAADIIGKCKSYTEKSKSGRGFHVLVKGDIPFKGKNNLQGVEVYKTARYFIMTGDVLLYGEITENQEAVDYIIQKYFPETERENDSDYGDKLYAPMWEYPKNKRIKLKPAYPQILQGNRNNCLTSLAGSLHQQGYSIKEIYNELTFCNSTACKPPLSQNELQTICNSIKKYKR